MGYEQAGSALDMQQTAKGAQRLRTNSNKKMAGCGEWGGSPTPLSLGLEDGGFTFRLLFSVSSDSRNSLLKHTGGEVMGRGECWRGRKQKGKGVSHCSSIGLDLAVEMRATATTKSGGGGVGS